MGGRSPILGGGRAMGRGWHPVKLLHVRYNLFAGTEMPSLSAYEQIAIQILLGGTVPQFGEGVKLGGSNVVPHESQPQWA